MQLLKYYCDYCEKQFQNTPAARKRHLQGVHLQLAKALYYQNSSSSSLPDANHQMHHESFGKGVCNRFLRTVTTTLSLSLDSNFLSEHTCVYNASYSYEIRVAAEKGAHVFFVPSEYGADTMISEWLK
ncbi:hypothetical protein RHGRI_014349 [Rhododendron griersonianum]|uniref:U1-C C2H2-type zinc finger domain-containing protein n=1 Tax=Rhododendron griersonianum TaxID=479676 RepID=A0AAV6K9B5_9ERIC|nr:hypothetical protein RHGRI_014349 [Rhododendron griersonianum]